MSPVLLLQLDVDNRDSHTALIVAVAVVGLAAAAARLACLTRSDGVQAGGHNTTVPVAVAVGASRSRSVPQCCQ